MLNFLSSKYAFYVHIKNSNDNSMLIYSDGYINYILNKFISLIKHGFLRHRMTIRRSKHGCWFFLVSLFFNNIYFESIV